MRLLYILVTVFLASLAGLSHTAAAETYQHLPTKLIFPDRIAGMEKTGVRDFENEHPGLGVAVNYSLPGIDLSIYVYSKRMSKVPDDLTSQVLEGELTHAIGEVRGVYREMKITSKGVVSLGPSAAKPNALAASFKYTQKGIKRLSELYLLGHRNHFFKVRFTYDEPLQKQIDSRRVQLREELGQLLRSGGGPRK